eukprot:scaffold7423_cov122-Cylindrotheca_fusiformis.AAC.2
MRRKYLSPGMLVTFEARSAKSKEIHAVKMTDDELQCLSDEQDMVLAILPIPSATLSILGSSTILYMAHRSRQRRKWTPYTRLLIGLSIYDIIASVSISIATFLRPASSARAWTFGNDATCSASAFITQLSHSTGGYNAMLSFYFLLTARLGFKNSYIARRFEPIMHFVSIGYFLGTAIVGAALGVYADTAVNDYPRNCGHEPGNTGEDCLSSRFGWIFIGYPYIFILAALAINNLSIYLFVKRQTRPSLREMKEQSSTDQSEQYLDEFKSMILDDSGTFNESQQKQRKSTFLPMHRRNDTVNRQKDQLRRLRLVSSQAFLFVANYLLVVCWSGILAIVEQQAETREEELAASVKLYPLMALNAIFLPLQGFFNMLVYIRPTYLKWRHKYPKESRPWAFRRTVFGESIQPENSQPLLPSPDIEHERDADKESSAEFDGVATGSIEAAGRLIRRDKISTLTANDGDSDPTGIKDCREAVNEFSAEAAGETAIPLGDTYRLIGSDRVSALTASDDDFDQTISDAGSDLNHTSPRKFQFSLSYSKGSGLEVISELSASVFESIMPMLDEEDECNCSLPSNSEAQRLPSKEIPRNLSSKRRWSSSVRARADGRDTGSLALRVPKRWESGTEVPAIEDDGSSSIPSDDDETYNLDSESRASHSGGDTPIRVPVRKLSPPPSFDETMYSC